MKIYCEAIHYQGYDAIMTYIISGARRSWKGWFSAENSCEETASTAITRILAGNQAEKVTFLASLPTRRELAHLQLSKTSEEWKLLHESHPIFQIAQERGQELLASLAYILPRKTD